MDGEGLQHQDGHSHLLASTIPNCVAYDPAYGYELAVIIQDGLRRMIQERESVFYYVTVMNENYVQPTMPEGVEEVSSGALSASTRRGSQERALAGQRHHPPGSAGGGPDA